jgi:erythromycin esterase
MKKSIPCLLFLCSFLFQKLAAQQNEKIFILPEDFRAIQDHHLAPLLLWLGDSRIVASSEIDHGKNEPLYFRNSLIKLLVKKKMIDVVALESGVIESKILYDYVLNRSQKEINATLADGLSWHFHVIPQNEELIGWLKEYNADKNNTHKVKLYGFDIPGSPGNPGVKRKMNTSLLFALEYLQKVDMAAHRDFHRRLSPFSDYLHVDFNNRLSQEKQYSQLKDVERQQLNMFVMDLIRHLEVNELQYCKKISVDEFDWAYRAALSSRQVLDWLGYIPVSYIPPHDVKVLNDSKPFIDLFHYRDRAMFDNVEWILKREPLSRIFIFASTNHLLKVPVEMLTDSTHYSKEVLGNYLALRYGGDYKLIANIVPNPGSKEPYVGNFFIDKSHPHYYQPVFSGKTEPTNTLKTFFQSDKKRLNLNKAADVILFDTSQSDIPFRGN